MIPTSEAKASSVNLVKYLENENWRNWNSNQNLNLTIAEPSTATMMMQNREDQSPIQSLVVR